MARHTSGCCHVTVEPGRARSEGKTASHWLPVALRLQGNLRWRNGKSAAAERSWLRSAAVAEAIGTRYQLGLTTAEIGRCLNRRNELERAAVLFKEVGALPDLARVQQLLASTRSQ